MSSSIRIIAPHTTTDRVLKDDPSIITEKDLHVRANDLLLATGMRPVAMIDPHSELAKAAENLGHLYFRCGSHTATHIEIDSFCSSLLSSGEVPLSFWTERYDTLVSIVQEYTHLTEDWKESVDRVNQVLIRFSQEDEGRPALLANYARLVKEGKIEINVFSWLTEPSNAGVKNEQFIAAFKQFGTGLGLHLQTMEEAVADLKGLDCSFEEFIAYVNGKPNLERKLNVSQIAENLSTNPYTKDKSIETVQGFYDSQIRGNANVSSSALFYFILFLDRFNHELGAKPAETGCRLEINQARGGCRWNVTEKLWEAISCREVNLDFFRSIDRKELEQMFQFMFETEKANYEICIAMKRLNITDPGQDLYMERPSILQKLMGPDRLLEKVLNQTHN